MIDIDIRFFLSNVHTALSEITSIENISSHVITFILNDITSYQLTWYSSFLCMIFVCPPLTFLVERTGRRSHFYCLYTVADPLAPLRLVHSKSKVQMVLTQARLCRLTGAYMIDCFRALKSSLSHKDTAKGKKRFYGASGGLYCVFLLPGSGGVDSSACSTQ